MFTVWRLQGFLYWMKLDLYYVQEELLYFKKCSINFYACCLKKFNWWEHVCNIRDFLKRSTFASSIVFTWKNVIKAYKFISNLFYKYFLVRDTKFQQCFFKWEWSELSQAGSTGILIPFMKIYKHVSDFRSRSQIVKKCAACYDLE